MTDPTALRRALAARLELVPGLKGLAYVPGVPNPPVAVVGQWTVDYDQTLARGYDRWRFAIRIFVAPTVDRQSQEALDAFFASAGVSSVKAALEGDQTLGGIASTCRVVRIGPAPQVFSAGGQDYIGCDIEVEVLARGS